jgi:hypothetical protein
MKRLLAASAVSLGLLFGFAPGAPARPSGSCTETEPGVTTCTATRGNKTCTAVFVNGELVSAECQRVRREP